MIDLFGFLCCPAEGESGKLYKPLRHRVIRAERTIVNTTTVTSVKRKERAFLYEPSGNLVPAFIYLSTDFGRKLLYFDRCLITDLFCSFISLSPAFIVFHHYPDLFSLFLFSQRSRHQSENLFLSGALKRILGCYS